MSGIFKALRFSLLLVDCWALWPFSVCSCSVLVFLCLLSAAGGKAAHKTYHSTVVTPKSKSLNINSKWMYVWTFLLKGSQFRLNFSYILCVVWLQKPHLVATLTDQWILRTGRSRLLASLVIKAKEKKMNHQKEAQRYVNLSPYVSCWKLYLLLKLLFL